MSRIPSASPEVGVIRTYVDWLVGLPWNVSTDDNLDISEAAPRSSRRTTTAWRRSRSASSSTSRCAPWPTTIRSPILALRRPARRGQDLARQERRPRHGPQVRAHEPGRHPRRGGDPRPPSDLHRRAARPGHPEHQDRRLEQPCVHARRGRQDRHGLPWRPDVRAARGPRSGAEQHLPGQLPRRCPSTCRKVLFIATGNLLDSDPAALRDRMEIIQLPGYTAAGEDRDRQAFLIPKQMEQPRPDGRSTSRSPKRR